MNACINEAALHTGEGNTLAKSYRSLKDVRDRYLSSVNTQIVELDNNYYLPTKFSLGGKLLQDAGAVIMELRSGDKIFKDNVISFAQGKAPSIDALFQELFLGFKDSGGGKKVRKKINNVGYYQLDNAWQKSIGNPCSGAKLL